jgi:transmembrane sensor
MNNAPPILHLVAESPVEAAARWFALRRRRLDRAEERKFAEWLEADPANRRAYDEVNRSWEVAAVAAADPAIAAMRSEALTARPREHRDYSRLWGALATAALVLIAFTGVSLTHPGFMRSADGIASSHDHLVLRTGVGERATASLEDGSTVVLNTNSVLEINYSKLRRDVRLVAGQVLFKVAHDTARPFVVAAANHAVVAVGTEFEVRLEGEKMRVALLQGRVRVESIAGHRDSAADEGVAVMAPGEQLTASSAGVVINHANVQELVSWQTGRVRFDNARLADAAAEMNRYSTTKIVLDDPAAENIRITGAFRAGQSYLFAQTVGEAFPLNVEQSGDTIRLRSRG